MSRIIVYDLNNQSAGEIHAVCNRGWAIGDGGATSLVLAEAEAVYPWVQLGRVVYVDHPTLPGWAGVIDTPWNAIGPVTVAVYDIPYLLSLRSPETPGVLKGTIGEMAAQILSLANLPEDMFVRVGLTEVDDISREKKFDQTPVWDQLKKQVTNAGMEMTFRPEVGGDNRLMIYLDIKRNLGIDTGFILQDGESGNMMIVEASLDGQIWNRVIGSTDESTQASRTGVGPLMDVESMSKYRMRNTLMLFKGASQPELEVDTAAYLETNSSPRLLLTVEALDQGDTFKYLRLGNTLRIRATRLILPGGIQGWDGYARIKAMNYDEGKNSVELSLEGSL